MPQRAFSLSRWASAVMCAVVCAASPAAAQAPDAPPVPATPATPARPPEAEQNLVNLSTTQLLKRHGSYFRITHRFSRDLRRGPFDELAKSFFSLDDGAVIGLEYRFAPTSRLQAGIHRSMVLKTIEMFGRYDGWRQGATLPVSLSLVGSVEGGDNFREDYAPGIGAVVSRFFGDVAALYASPTFVWNARLDSELPPVDPADDAADTFFIGVGARLRFRPTAYVVLEAVPRVAGYDPLATTWGVAIEKHTHGGHMFQLNFTNNFGTTRGQLARGGSSHDVYLGFNITRTF